MDRISGILIILLVGLAVKTTVLESRKFGDDLVYKEAAAVRRRITEVRQFLFPMGEAQWEHLKRHWATLLIPVHAESDICRNHSQYILQSFMEGEIWAMRMFDASSKLQSGILDGHLHNMGSYAECVSVVEPNNMFSGQHCVLETTGMLPQEISDLVERNKDSPFFGRDGMISLCVPSSCSDHDVITHADVGLASLGAKSRSYLDEFGLSTDITKISCSTADGIPFRTKDYCAMLVLATLTLVVLLATLTGAKSGRLACFNVFTNFHELMDCRVRPEDITCLNGLSVFSILLIIMGHRIHSILCLPVKHYWTVYKALDTYAMAFLELAIPRAVDVFFLLSGLTLSYNFFLKTRRKEDFKYLLHIFKRYCRVVVLAAAVLIHSTLLIHLSRGPLWKRIVARLEDCCYKNWWTTLLHISNFTNPGKMCVHESWYLAYDFQLQSLAPLILLLILRRPRLGLLVLAVCFVVSSAAVTALASYAEVSTGFWVSSVFNDRLTDLVIIFFHGGVLFTSNTFIMGLALGYLIFYCKQVKGYTQLSKRMVWLGWTTTVVVFVALFLVFKEVVSLDHHFTPVLDPLFVGLHRQIICACVSWLIFTCHFGHGGSINSFLSSPVFIPLAKLVFSVYLIHLYLQVLQLVSSQSAITVRYTEQLFLCLGEIAASFIIAAVIYTTIEIPFAKLSLQFFGDYDGRSRKNKRQ